MNDIYYNTTALIAQLEEQEPSKFQVADSNSAGGTNTKTDYYVQILRGAGLRQDGCSRAQVQRTAADEILFC